ncbi:30S ribosomal protein S1 [candidate division KSB1 bacterium]|nr:30S ribosomal protein S1 [candidate division KSB1 bacterium]
MNEQTNPNPLEEQEQEQISNEQSTADSTPVSGDTIEEEKEVEQPVFVAPEKKPETEPDDFQTGSVQQKEDLDLLESEYSTDEFDSMSKLYEQTLMDFKPGQIVIGKVLSISNSEVSIDIGFKSEGVVPLEEFGENSEIEVGENIEVLIDEIEDSDGYLVLSKKKADFNRVWEQVIKSYETGEILPGRCTRRIKGGIVVDLGGVDAFLPGSQIDVRPIRDFDALIGNMMDFKIVKVNHLRKNIVVSHRVLVEEEMKGQREKILTDLDRGQILEGTVKNITDFGVFIDLGGVDGLLHINDLSWGRVSHPSEVVALDEKIKIVVLDYNENKDRISLGLKQLQPHPWEKVEEKYPVGAVIRGKVVSISDYGAFVELEKGVEGLIHISEMSWTQHIKHPSKILAVGEMVEAKVLNIQKEERKISLGLKQLEPDPWETLMERYPVGSRHTGKVRNLTNFGAFVELEDGIDGLIHISDLSWTKKIRHPGEVVKKGDEIEVVVLNVDRQNRRISLGYKQIQDNPWDFFQERYQPGTMTEGKVVRLIEKGLLAELPDGVDGFVPMSQLAKEGISKPADGYQIDDVITLKVIEFNKENKKIVLSERGVHTEEVLPLSDEEKEEIEKASDFGNTDDYPNSRPEKGAVSKPKAEKKPVDVGKSETEAKPEAEDEPEAAVKPAENAVDETAPRKAKTGTQKAKSKDDAKKPEKAKEETETTDEPPHGEEK